LRLNFDIFTIPVQSIFQFQIIPLHKECVLKGSWSRVSESVPLKAMPVVIVYDPELIEGVTAAMFDGKDFRSISDGDEIFNTVTHWMPLPDPPEEEEDIQSESV
jgi:hypothetical protein